MKEVEFGGEDGEACFGMEKDTCVDPDVDFSYIDVRIHDVLGDFQKDFESGFFTEISGAIYGGYGSFLPSYKRLPQTRNAPKALDRTVVPSTRGSSHEGTCGGLLNQMKISSTSFKNSNFGGSSKMGASTSATTTENHTKDHNMINKVGTMPAIPRVCSPVLQTLYEDTCDGLLNQMKVSSTSFKNSNLGGFSKVGASTSATTTENHTRDRNVINKVGTMPTKKNFHARDVTIEPLKSRGRTIAPSTCGSSYEGTCDGLSNQMKVSNASSFKNSNLGVSSKVGASKSTNTTENHTKDHNVINKVGTMPAKKKNFHARDVSIERKFKRLKSRKESRQNYSEELQREVDRPDLMVAPIITKKGVTDIKMDMKNSSWKSLDRKSGTASFEEHVETFMDGPICDQPSSDVAVGALDDALVNNWACCDLCEKWRLLPNGIKPEDLPKKWECCMQYWLPAKMNCCIITEAETTNFMNLHYHASLPKANSNLDLSTSSTCSATLRVNQMSHEVVSRCDVNGSQVHRPRNISSERQNQKFKLKEKKLQCCSDEVDIISGVGRDLEMMSNELFHPDIPVEKKIKSKCFRHLNNDGKLSSDLPAKVSPPHLNNGTTTANSIGKKIGKIRLKISSSLNGTMKEHLDFQSGKKFKHVNVIDTRMSDKSEFPVKKRKARESHDTKSNQETAMRSQHLGETKSKLGEEYIKSNVREENRDNAPNIKRMNCVLEENRDTDLIKMSSAQAVSHSPSHVSHLISSVKANGLECATGETYDNLADIDKPTEECEDKNIAHHGSFGLDELDRLFPLRKCQPSSAALMAMKEARELKHAADRMKNVEQELERASIYFQAALKFMQAASLSEPSSDANMNYEELNESLKIYTETAAFCKFCALEYDRRNEMAFSALAYKCVEVAYFKVAFLKSHFASKDHQELQEAIHAFWPGGDSPSSSASDLVNLNHPGGLEKITCPKVVSSLQMTDSHAIASRNTLYQWLDYTQVAVFAFEASMKSQNALAMASTSLGKNGCDSIASLKETLNFDFHNVEELLRHIRASMEFFYH